MRESMSGAPEEAADILLGSFARAFDPEWLGEQILVVIEDALAYLDGSRDALTAEIDLTANKEILVRELNSAFEALSDEQREALEIDPEGPGMEAADLVTEMDLPDRLHLGVLLGDDGALSDLEQTASDIRQYRTYLRLLPLVLVLLLVAFGAARRAQVVRRLPGGLRPPAHGCIDVIPDPVQLGHQPGRGSGSG